MLLLLEALQFIVSALPLNLMSELLDDSISTVSASRVALMRAELEASITILFPIMVFVPEIDEELDDFSDSIFGVFTVTFTP